MTSENLLITDGFGTKSFITLETRERPRGSFRQEFWEEAPRGLTLPTERVQIRTRESEGFALEHPSRECHLIRYRLATSEELTGVRR